MRAGRLRVSCRVEVSLNMRLRGYAPLRAGKQRWGPIRVGRRTDGWWGPGCAIGGWEGWKVDACGVEKPCPLLQQGS